MVVGKFTSSRNSKFKMHLLLYRWFQKMNSTFIVLSIVSIIFLIFVYQFIFTVEIVPGSLLQRVIQILTIILISLIEISILYKGIIPLCICTLGLSLIYTGIILPSGGGYHLIGESHFKTVNIFVTQQTLEMAAQSYFLLGVFMVLLSMIVGYRPSLLYTKNRPCTLESLWKDYPIWDGNNTNLVGRHSNTVVPLKTLMTDEEKYLLWRYEYVLVNIYGKPHLVRTDLYVPLDSIILRDNKTGKMIGKPKYSGYFV